MLKELRISNIILIESTEIMFAQGLNVLSGETGSGKSALMNALSLIMGERADTGIIRRGAEKGIVEALFDIEGFPELKLILEEGGIDHDEGEPLLIRREVNANGKSRSFINNQGAHVGLLRKVGEVLADIVGQHANQKLLSTDKHREIVDLYGNLGSEADKFARSWEKENAIRSQLDTLIANEAQRLREVEVCRMELEELQEANLKEEEEEKLFAEYTLLANVEEIAQKAGEITNALSGERQAILLLLNRYKASFEQLVRLDPSLADTAKSYENAVIELQEVAHELRNYRSKLEANPDRTSKINERLSLITRLKRKYGSSVTEIKAYQAKAEKRLYELENVDTQIDELQAQLKILEEANHLLSKQLTEKRKAAAKALEKAVVIQLRSLNMPKADFQVEITSQNRTRHGDDRIEFFMIPNVGEHRISIKDCASGGELSRVMLAIQALLAGKAKIPILIFDEIDANIGGETAVIVGEKLHKIGSQHQVICITHFPQVAKQADHHLQISKIEKEGRTLTVLKVLKEDEREVELARMMGG